MGQIPVEVFLDSKALCDSIVSTKQVEEKEIRHIITSFKQRLVEEEIHKFDWVCTKEIYADLLTKPGVKPDFLFDVMETGEIQRSS